MPRAVPFTRSIDPDVLEATKRHQVAEAGDFGHGGEVDRPEEARVRRPGVEQVEERLALLGLGDSIEVPLEREVAVEILGADAVHLALTAAPEELVAPRTPRRCGRARRSSPLAGSTTRRPSVADALCIGSPYDAALMSDDRPGGRLGGQRPLHLYLLVDRSGSMEGDKIRSVNGVIEETLPMLRDEAENNPHVLGARQRGPFAEDVEWLTGEPQPVETFAWADLKASGRRTAMGAASGVARDEARRPRESSSARSLRSPCCLSDGSPDR